MIKVLGLALYGPLAASNRYRLGQYVPGLASIGIDLQIRHLLGDDYLSARFSGGALPIASILKAGLSRFEDLWHQNEYDIVMLQCELIPLMPGWLERALIRKRYIYDFDDAFYLKYRSGRLGIARSVLGRKFDNVLGGAAAVTAGNQILSDYASQFNANTQYLPTVVDTARYIPCPASRGGQVFTVGWIGSPSTARYLSELVAPLSVIGLEGPVRFVVIGGKAPVVPNVTVVEIDWNENTEIDSINSFDVGVMPLPDDAWARGKCAFKLIQYMACAVPVIASPVGANVDVVTSKCGLMASTPKEWVDALRTLRDQPSSRAESGQLGRERVEQYYSLHQNLPVLADVITNTARSMN
jgi:glycosyltransferase involved in cell wall biosynthesis